MKITSILASLAFVCVAQQASAHCEVPCGIYADDNVFVSLETDIKTIEKAMTELNGGKLNNNQSVRWVTNKESHATSIQTTMSQYFITQRVKLSEAKESPETYANKLTLIHQVIVYSMKCKQTTDLENVKLLSKALADFKTAYNAK